MSSEQEFDWENSPLEFENFEFNNDSPSASGYGLDLNSDDMGTQSSVPMLLSLLVERGVITDAEVPAILAEAIASGQTLSMVLLRLNKVAPDQLVTVLNQRSRYA
jgi:hypothetical protein